MHVTPRKMTDSRLKQARKIASNNLAEGRERGFITELVRHVQYLEMELLDERGISGLLRDVCHAEGLLPDPEATRQELREALADRLPACPVLPSNKEGQGGE